MKKILILACVSAALWSSYAASDVLPEDANYCTQAGGTAEMMPAEFTTVNGTIQGQSRSFCTFSANNGFVAIGLETFSSEKPSIAATYIKTLEELGDDSPLWRGNSTNPSYNVCKNLNGTMIGFTLHGSFTNSLGEADICVFGDGSMVSAWSLIYMANHRDGYDLIREQIRSAPLALK